MRHPPRWPGWRAAWRALAGSDQTDRNLAAALALGVLVAPTPVLGLHTWMAIGLAFLLRVNRLAAFIGSNLANPLTMAPLVWLDIELGARLLGRPAPVWPGRSAVWARLGQLYLEAWVGALVLGVAGAAVTYVLARLLLPGWRRRAQSATDASSPASGDAS
ncbi:MAG: DUF2062 domain-containing protein [Candidatus Krumholzibacteriia bacterium]